MLRSKAIVWFVLLALALATVACGGAAVAPVATEIDTTAARQAAEWLVATHQNEDGGFAAFSAGSGTAPSDVVGTLDALPALAAAGADPAPLLDFLIANGPALGALGAEDGGQAGKVVLALRAAGADPIDFAEQNFVVQLAGHATDAGTFGAEDTYKQSLAMIGLAAAGEPVPEAAVTWLLGKQAANGSWDDGFGTLDNPDATAVAIMALLAAGRKAEDPPIEAAVDFLAGAQVDEGGWGYGAGQPASANSTALVVQALTALGEDVTATDGRWAKGGRSPLDALLAFQGESGAFQADFGDGPFDDFFSTVQAIPAAAGRTMGGE